MGAVLLDSFSQMKHRTNKLIIAFILSIFGLK